jgi:hypothetical protein
VDRQRGFSFRGLQHPPLEGQERQSDRYDDTKDGHCQMRPGKMLRRRRAFTFLRHVAAFFSPFGILRARIVFSYIRRRLDQNRLTEKCLICQKQFAIVFFWPLFLSRLPLQRNRLSALDNE